MRLQNSKSRITLCCPVARHADNWVQSRVTLQILEPSRVTQITFPTLLILVFGPTQFSHLTSFFSHEADCTLHGHLGQKEQR